MYEIVLLCEAATVPEQGKKEKKMLYDSLCWHILQWRGGTMGQPWGGPRSTSNFSTFIDIPEIGLQNFSMCTNFTKRKFVTIIKSINH